MKEGCCLLVVLVVLTVCGSTQSEEIPPEAFDTFAGIVNYWGYPCETHYAITEDGYNLTVYRIPFGRRGNSSSPPGPPVILQHGLLDWSVTWIVNLPNQSLAFVLADAGFDVWLPNNRGNKESRWPTTTGVTPKEKEWWQFSWDQMALYDVPGVINYVLKVNGARQVSYVGHSEGTTQMFAGILSNPALVNVLSSFVGFGPVTFANNLEQTTFRELAEYHLDNLYDFFDGKLFAPLPDWIRFVDADFCALEPFACENVIEWICGPHKGAFNASVMPLIGAQEPGGTSAMNMVHWGQMVRSAGEIFQMFDYGVIDNPKHYGQRKPPRYDLEKYPSNLPTQLWSGGEDVLADPIDVAVLLAFLPNTTLHTQIPSYAHLDYVWAIDAVELIYGSVINFISSNLP